MFKSDQNLMTKKYFSVNQQFAESSSQSEQTVFGLNQKLPLNVLICILYFFAIGSSFTELYKHFKGKISKPSIIQEKKFILKIILCPLKSTQKLLIVSCFCVLQTFFVLHCVSHVFWNSWNWMKTFFSLKIKIWEVKWWYFTIKKKNQ